MCPVWRVWRFMRSVCSQVRVQVRPGKVLFPWPHFAAAAVTDPHSFIQIRKHSFYMQFRGSCGSYLTDSKQAQMHRHTQTETETGGLGTGNLRLAEALNPGRMQAKFPGENVCLILFFNICSQGPWNMNVISSKPVESRGSEWFTHSWMSLPFPAAAIKQDSNSLSLPLQTDCQFKLHKTRQVLFVSDCLMTVTVLWEGPFNQTANHLLTVPVSWSTTYGKHILQIKYFFFKIKHLWYFLTAICCDVKQVQMEKDNFFTFKDISTNSSN